MASAATPSSGTGITINGANDSDTINLGNGNDDVTLGSAVETVNGHGGNNTFHVTGSTIGATINGGTGANTLDVSGGGTVVMGSNVTGIATINLQDLGGVSQPDYVFTANNTANLVINGTSNADTITLGAASQTVNGKAGSDHIIVSAANAGALICGGNGTNTLEITGGGMAVMNAGDTKINVVQLDAATSLTLDNENNLTINGSAGNDGFTLGGGKGVALNSNGGYDTYRVGTNIGTASITNAVSGGTAANGEVDFLSGITDESLWFKKVGTNLEIDLLGTKDSLTLNGWYGNNASAKVAEFTTADGLKLDNEVAQLVQAMASYATAHPGFNPATATAMPTDTSLQSVIAASWHH